MSSVTWSPHVVDEVGVAALAADHGVGAGAAVEDVGAVISGQLVAVGIAGRVDAAVPSQLHVLDRARQAAEPPG